MISFLQGKIRLSQANHLIIQVGGVGYKVQLPLNSLLEGSDVELFIYTHFNQDSGQQLWGFYDANQLKLFEQLVQVNGVGPKTAALLVHMLGVEKVISAINSSDAGGLKVPGIGSKTAERILIDLRGKVGESSVGGSVVVGGVDSKLKSDVVGALENLGYSSKLAEAMFSNAKIDNTMNTAEAIKAALAGSI